MSDYLAGCVLGAGAVLLLYALLESEKKQKAYQRAVNERLEHLESYTRKKAPAPVEVN